MVTKTSAHSQLPSAAEFDPAEARPGCRCLAGTGDGPVPGSSPARGHGAGSAAEIRALRANLTGLPENEIESEPARETVKEVLIYQTLRAAQGRAAESDDRKSLDSCGKWKPPSQLPALRVPGMGFFRVS